LAQGFWASALNLVLLAVLFSFTILDI